jgi:hypothetical protein
MAVKRCKKSKVSAPIVDATAAAVGLLSMIGSASAADGSASHTAPVSQIVLSDEADVTLAGWYDGYYYSPAPTCEFWGKECRTAVGHRHHHHHRGARGV